MNLSVPVSAGPVKPASKRPPTRYRVRVKYTADSLRYVAGDGTGGLRHASRFLGDWRNVAVYGMHTTWCEEGISYFSRKVKFVAHQLEHNHNLFS